VSIGMQKSSLCCVQTGDGLAMAVLVEQEMRLGGDGVLLCRSLCLCGWAGITVDLPLYKFRHLLEHITCCMSHRLSSTPFWNHISHVPQQPPPQQPG
jgi:hypothetical protein